MEFDLIARIRARATRRDDVVLGIGDDAALLRVPPGELLVLSTDTLNAGVHFPVATAAADVGWKSLAVNLSDLAAMAAKPAWCTLSLSLPEPDAVWLEGFLDGFLALASEHHVTLVGGDTTRGPLSINVAVHGFVPEAEALRRDAARTGDEIWVTGTLGDAAAALRGLLDASPESRRARGSAALRARLDRPTPRVSAGIALRGLAHACIDLSDGLAGDLRHVLRASGVGASIDAGCLPASSALRATIHDDDARWTLQLGGGDDYELCFTAPVDAHGRIVATFATLGVAVTVIGRVDAGEGLRCARADGRPFALPAGGWVHFDGAAT